MKNQWLISVALAGGVAMAPLSTFAQANSGVADPQAAVPAVVYQSVFKDSPKGVETQATDWKKANADVAQFPRGHFDLLKWEEAQDKAKRVETGPDNPARTSGSGLAQPVAPARGPLVMPAAAHKH